MDAETLGLEPTSDWFLHVQSVLDTDDGRDLLRNLHAARLHQTVYPPPSRELQALQLTPLADTRVVIIGQDPYHGPEQAQGLSFSVPNTLQSPPSLRNIMKSLAFDLSCEFPPFSDLSPWARQGCLLWNATLTVEAGKPLSHANLGWDCVTSMVLATLATQAVPPIFVLWGRVADAAVKPYLLDTHCVIRSVHPSPLSAHRGFLTHRPFSRINQLLVDRGQEAIDWLDRSR